MNNYIKVFVRVGELRTGFQDVALLISQTSFSSTFLTCCGRGERLRTTTCLQTVVGGKQGHALCKILSLQQILFLVSFEFHRDHKTVIKFKWIWPPSVLMILLDLKQWCLSANKMLK